MAEPHASYDDLVDLALDDADPRDAELLRHLARCGSCRRRYDEVVAGVEQVLAATPRIDPPPGFDRSVLAAMGMASGPTGPRRSRRTRWAVLAAAAVVGVVLGVGGTLAWTALDDREPTPGAAAAATLDTAQGEPVGSVTRSYLEGQPVIVVRVDDGVVGKSYECVLVLDDGRTLPAGRWTMEAPEATWIVPAPPDGVDAVRLVTAEGGVWSAADLAG